MGRAHPMREESREWGHCGRGQPARCEIPEKAILRFVAQVRQTENLRIVAWETPIDRVKDLLTQALCGVTAGPLPRIQPDS